jgi:hypothetical protein
MRQLDLPRVTLSQAASRPQLDFVLPGLLTGTVGMIVGQGAIGKSFLALQIGIAVTTGLSVAGGLWKPEATGPVTIIGGEDEQRILHERLYWLRQHYGFDDNEAANLDELLDVRSAYGHDMRIVQKTPGGVERGPFYEKARLAAEGQRLLILDPTVFLHDGDENDNGIATQLMQALAQIAQETGCAIIILHHVSKSSTGDDGREDWAAARGASALTTACRWQVNLRPPSKQEMQDYGITDEARRFWVRTAVTKVNYGDGGNPAWLKRGKGGVLKTEEMQKVKPNGDSGGKKKKGGYNYDDDF